MGNKTLEQICETDFLSVNQAAEALCVTKDVIYDAISNGRLHAERPPMRSRGWKVSRDELERWYAEDWIRS